MAREDVELIRRLAEERDVETALAYYDADVIWTTNEGEVDGGSFRGIEALRGLFETWSEAFEDFWAETTDIAELGDWVVTRARWHGTARQTGLPAEFHGIVAYRVLRDRIVEAREFRDLDQARAALGR